MSHHKVEVKDLHYQYPDGHKAVQGISFEVHHGDAVGIIGANGAGKSTLLLLLLGLVFPNQGEVIVGEVLMTKKTVALIRQRMGLVFQNPEDQLFMTTVFDDVAFGLRNNQLEEKDVERRVLQTLERVGILHLKDRPPYRLSGGEKRIAALAAVLAMQPDLLVLDEPTDALDPKARRRVMGLLQAFSHTKIITSHDLDMIYDLCDRVIVLKDGEVAADGPAEELLKDADLMAECGLELPLRLQNCPVCGSIKR